VLAARTMPIPVVATVVVLFITALGFLLVAAHGIDSTPRQ
jgi:hydrogenase/urease accessory protein HupE